MWPKRCLSSNSSKVLSQHLFGANFEIPTRLQLKLKCSQAIYRDNLDPCDLKNRSAYHIIELNRDSTQTGEGENVTRGYRWGLTKSRKGDSKSRTSILYSKYIFLQKIDWWPPITYCLPIVQTLPLTSSHTLRNARVKVLLATFTWNTDPGNIGVSYTASLLCAQFYYFISYCRPLSICGVCGRYGHWLYFGMCVGFDAIFSHQMAMVVIFPIWESVPLTSMNPGVTKYWLQYCCFFDHDNRFGGTCLRTSNFKFQAAGTFIIIQNIFLWRSKFEKVGQAKK